MASQKREIILVLVVVSMFLAGTWAQSSNSCTNVLMSMSPCLNYITGNSSTPSSGCCTQLANVVRSQPQCLCQAISGGGSSFGINVNQTQALALPGACKVQTPPTSACNGSASPTDTPAGKTNTPSTVPSGTGSKTVPSTESGTSSGSSTKMTISMLLVFLMLQLLEFSEYCLFL